MNDSFLETRQVIKRYANHTALDGVSFSFYWKLLRKCLSSLLRAFPFFY